MFNQVKQRWAKRAINIGMALAAIILIGLVFFLGVSSERSGFYREVLDPGLKRITLPVLNAFRGTPDNVPELHIQISAEDMDSLRAIRARALVSGALMEGKDDYFPCTFSIRDSAMQGKIRLKGDLVDHLRTSKWSFRIKLENGDTLMGMSTFSLQHPNTRNFANEWLFHKAMENWGLPSLRYQFIKVKLNKDEMGIYAVEEHFNKDLLQRIGYGSGPVVKFDDALWIDAESHRLSLNWDIDTIYTAGWLAAPVDAFHLKDALKDKVTRTRFQNAVLALEGFRRGERSTSEVFNTEKLAMLFAIGDILGAQHAHDWRNLRFVPDSITEKLIPIGFDGNAGEPITAIRALREQSAIRFSKAPTDNFYSRLFSDPAFYTAYIKDLDSLSRNGSWAKFFDSVKEELDHEEDIIRTEFPNAGINTAVFDHDLEVIRRTIYPIAPVQAHFQGLYNERPRIEAANIQGLPVQVTAVIFDGDTITIEPVLLLPRPRNRSLEFIEVPVRVKLSSYPQKMALICQLYGMDKLYDINIQPWRVK